MPEPIFTPATKAVLGEHDENIGFDRMIRHIGEHLLEPDSAGALAEAIREHALALYRYGAAVSARKGILLADTKFEFGLAFRIEESEPPEPIQERLVAPWPLIGRRPPVVLQGPPEDHLILIDEVMTPDSSRFWDAGTYEPGRPQTSFDKQFVRDWLETQPWDKTAPGPELPPDVIEGTRARYVAAYERITGASFARYLKEDVIAQ